MAASDFQKSDVVNSSACDNNFNKNLASLCALRLSDKKQKDGYKKRT